MYDEKYGELVYTSRVGTKYFKSCTNHVCHIIFKRGNIVKVDSDILDHLIENKYTIGITKVREQYATTRFSTGYAVLKQPVTKEAVIPLHALACGISKEQTTNYIYVFNDGDSLNLLRDNITIYKRIMKIAEKNGESFIRVNKVSREKSGIESIILTIDTDHEHVLYEDESREFRSLGISIVENRMHAIFNNRYSETPEFSRFIFI